MALIQKLINEELDIKAPASLFKGPEVVDIMVVNTVQIKCKVCGSDKVNVREEQRRSADEPATQLFTCLSCGNKWKKG